MRTVSADCTSCRASNFSGAPTASVASRKQVLENDEVGMCSSVGRKSAHPTGYVQSGRKVYRGFSGKWDNSQEEERLRSPDLHHRQSQGVPWLNNVCKPAGVDWQLDALNMWPYSAADWIPADENDTCRSVGHDSDVTPETVSRLCQEGLLPEAVEALGVLVRANCWIAKSLLSNVMKICIVNKDLVLGRRVHALTVKKGYQSDKFLGFHILRMYASHGKLRDAMDVFALLAKPDAFTWSTIISAHVKHGQEKKAVQLYQAMRRSKVKPDGHVFVAALQACARALDLKAGQQVHADVFAGGAQGDLFVCNGLVNMYAKCGSLEDAHCVFDGLGQKDVVTWNGLIAGYSQKGLGQEALRLYSDMQEDGSAPDSVTFLCLLQACASLGASALGNGKQLHQQIKDRGYQADVFIGSSLVNMYAKCGSLEDAQRVFDGLAQKDVVTWTAMIAGYSQQGMGLEALRLYGAMQEGSAMVLDSVTILCLLQACASVGTPALERGKQLHAQITEQRHQPDVFVATSLVNMYVKCGSLEDAQRVFDRLGQKGVVTWNVMLAGYSQQGMGKKALSLYKAMQEGGYAVPDSVTFVCLLQACANLGTPALEKGKELHAQIRERGHDADVFVANSLVNMYAKCGSLEEAQKLFDGLREKDVVTWNAMIAGYSQQGVGQEALVLYSSMLDEGITPPNSVTFSCLLQACASVGTAALDMGKKAHAQIMEGGHHSDGFLSSGLVNMYAKCGSLEDAQRVFDGVGKKEVVTWTALISGYCQQGMGQEALRLYGAMMEEGLAVPDPVTFVCLLQACAIVGTPALENGKQLHLQIRERGLGDDVFVGSSLVNMYAKCGSLEDAEIVFDELGQKDLVTWTALIAGYSQREMSHEALRLYSVMQVEGIAVPNAVTFVCLLQACANVAALHLGRQLHIQIQEQGLQADVFVAGSLINMYGKSGSMVDAQEVFDAMDDRDVGAWNALIAGYTCQGDSEAVFDLVQRMREDGIQPVDITFLSVLTVCSHAGLVNQGWEYFEDMTEDFGITPTEDHYTCMVDLLSRAGQLDEALALAQTMPGLPCVAVWHTLLGACRKWRNVEVGRHAFGQAVKADDKDAAAYVLMSNVYTSAQMWKEAQKLQMRRKIIRAWKQPGQSFWTDEDGLVHSFLAGDE